MLVNICKSSNTIHIILAPTAMDEMSYLFLLHSTEPSLEITNKEAPSYCYFVENMVKLTLPVASYKQAVNGCSIYHTITWRPAVTLLSLLGIPAPVLRNRQWALIALIDCAAIQLCLPSVYFATQVKEFMQREDYGAMYYKSSDCLYFSIHKTKYPTW